MAKFNIIHAFRAQLDQEPEIAANTKKKYYQSVKNILAGVDFDDPADIDPALITQRVKKLKTRNDVSAAKRGMEYFAEYYPEFRLPEEIGEISKHKRNYKKRKWEPLKLDTVIHKINGIHNKKLKYGYRLMLATGLRVSEVEQIRKKDISFNGADGMELFIKHTKSGCSATVRCKDPYLIQRLSELVPEMEDDAKVFCSAKYMMDEATELGIECHDLRRGFAKTKYRELKPKIGSYRAVGAVKELLRHGSCRTTKVYLGRKII